MTMSPKRRDAPVCTTVNVRMTPGLVRDVDHYVSLDKGFASRSDFIVSAVRHYLAYLIETERFKTVITLGPGDKEPKVATRSRGPGH